MDDVELIEFIGRLPDGIELEWYCDEMGPDKPYATGWVDIWLDRIMAWTISFDDPRDLRWEPDMIALYLIDPHRHEPYVFSIAIPIADSDNVSAHTMAQIGGATIGNPPDCYWNSGPAWSVAAINACLEHWCLTKTGRRVKAVWDMDHGPSPMMQEAIDTMAAVRSGEQNTYMLVPGANEGGEGATVMVSDTMMDQLTEMSIADPEQVEAIMATLSELRQPKKKS